METDQGGITKAVNWKGGGGFRYYRLAPSLLEKDKWGNWVINKQYNAAMLAEAICKLEGFVYAPSDSIYWQHGHSTERDFIYVTTQNLSHDQLQALNDEVGQSRSLLVLCSAFRGKSDRFPNLTIKKIPNAVLKRCEWGHDDYSLRVENLPKAPPKPGQLPLFRGGGGAMKKKPTSPPAKKKASLYERIRQILESARTNVSRTVNTTQVVSNWLIGREIVEEEQQGKRRAGYGENLLIDLAERLRKEYGKGWSVRNLEYCRKFYLEYSVLLAGLKSNAVRSISLNFSDFYNSNATSSKSEANTAGKKVLNVPQGDSPIPPASSPMLNAPLGKPWQPGYLHPNLSWTHYRTLLRVERNAVRSFYEIETVRNNWKTRELERQINSLLYERLALSKDKKGLMRLATKGQEIQEPADVFKDPLVMEFLGLPESPKLVESNLEQALINNLQAFLLELGRGFAFVSRQERITLDGDHFYIDLVFYHTILKCFVVIDLKVGKLTHQDLGQLQLYVNYYDQERRTEGDNPTLGLILCTDKNDAVVRYTLGPAQQKKIFASRYKLYLPTEAELKAELRRELRVLSDQSKSERTK